MSYLRDKLIQPATPDLCLEIEPMLQTIVERSLYSSFSSSMSSREDGHGVRSKSFIAKHIQDKCHFTPDLHIVDVGGGDGEFLSCLGQLVGLPKSHLTVIESQQLDTNVWASEEPYDFTRNQNWVQHVFWDHHTFASLDDQSVDVVFLNVTLHHLRPDLMEIVIKEIHRILRPVRGRLIIKEHDVTSMYERHLVDWEHHLYHIQYRCRHGLVHQPYHSYLEQFYGQYQTKESWTQWIESHGFQWNEYLDRFFYSISPPSSITTSRHYTPPSKRKDAPTPIPPPKTDTKNCTKLYWAIYQLV